MPSVKQALERQNNMSAILQAIRSAGKISRKELAEKLSLSWGCVSELVAMLIEREVVVEEVKAGAPAKGRAPTLLSLCIEIAVLGIDVNRTGLSCCLCNLYGQKLFEQTEPLDATDKTAVLRCIFSAIDRLRSQYPGIAVVSIAMQGVRDQAAACWRFPGDEPTLIDFEKDIAQNLDIPATIEHDPNCMLFGCIDNTESNSKMLVRIDCGIGAALYKYNRFFDDSLLELGYLVVGEKGQTLNQLLYNPDDLETVGRQLGTTLANFSNMIALDEIILCGDLLEEEDKFLPVLKQYYNTYAIDIARANITVERITNAAFGAARLAVERFAYLFRK